MAGNSNEQVPGAVRDALDAAGEFFSVGAPLHAVRAGYVRRSADDALFDTLAAGRYAHVTAPDRSGKSSLIAATAARLENNGIKVAIIDLEQIGVRDGGTDAGRWYYSVVYRLLRQLRIRVDLQSWWQDKAILSNRQRLLEFYSEVVLQNVQERIVVFIDEVQCIGELSFADQLLASIRAAHNARVTDPEFSRLTFALLGECDTLSLLGEPELSPFNITQPVTLSDFSRTDLELFATELNLAPAEARTALDRIYYWTGGQPYLTQKLARAVSREQHEADIAESVDRIAMQQLAGRAALHNEPLMSHIHREIVNDTRHREALLNLYGRICKGVAVTTDLGSPLQRRLMAVGLLTIDEEGRLAIRNRLFEAVFTARWANENLPSRSRTLLKSLAALLLIVAIPFWYMQLLPRPYVDVLTSETVELEMAHDAYLGLRSFPGHVTAADNLFRNFIAERARSAMSETDIALVADFARELPDAGRLPEELMAAWWDKRVRDATRAERRDDALLASLESFVLSTPQRRSRAAGFIGDDYSLLFASLQTVGPGTAVFDPADRILTRTHGAKVQQWVLGNDGLLQRETWTMTALEVAPLVRRIVVDRPGAVTRVGLTLNLSHARIQDLRIKVIAPSGRAVEIDLDVESASMNQDLRVPAAQLREMIGEPMSGTWSLAVRDEEPGVEGRLVGWHLNLDSQGLVEDFQRGLNIADPVEKETGNLWFSGDGRYAVARATQSDSARVWNLAHARPVRAVAVSEFEQLIGLSRNAGLLVTATRDAVHLWDTAAGKRSGTLPVGTGSGSLRLTADGSHLLVQHSSDIETVFELWSIEMASVVSRFKVAGVPALVSVEPDGTSIAVADFDLAVRVWNVADGKLLTQFDLDSQPSEIHIAQGGDVIGLVYGSAGASLWRIDQPRQPLLEVRGQGRWQMAFSPSGAKVLVGRGDWGYRLYDTDDGRLLGPPLGSGGDPDVAGLLAFSADEKIIVTGGAGTFARFWNATSPAFVTPAVSDDIRHTIWPPSGNAVAAVTPDAATILVGDSAGDVHILPAASGARELIAEEDEVSYFGHSTPVQRVLSSADGTRVASVAVDNTLRVWSVAGRQPLPFIADIAGDAVESLSFSPDASRLAVLTRSTIEIFDAATGNSLVRFNLAEPHHGLAFADDDHVYLGSASGQLSVVNRDKGGKWTVQSLWRADAGIRLLEASQQGSDLVLVDERNVARKFSLAEGRIGEQVLRLPSSVEEATFTPGSSRILFRTNGWVHRASSTATGLIWIDAIRTPRGLPNARIVFGDARAGQAASPGQKFYLPVAGDGFARIAELGFAGDRQPALFGTRTELLEEWRKRLGLTLVAAQGPDE